MMGASGGGGFGFGPSPTPEAGAAAGTVQSANQRLEATVSRLLKMSYDQITEWTAAQSSDADAQASDESEDDPDGFDPEEDSDADDDRGVDELQDEASEWDVLDAPTGAGRREADVVLRPADSHGSWIAVLVRPADAPGMSLPPLMRAALQGRDRTVLAVAQAIVEWQQPYLATCDPSDLRSLTQETVAQLAHLTKGRVSRALEKNTLQLPDGEIVPLEALVVDSDFTRARLIRDVFLEQDRILRVEGIAMRVESLAAWADVYQVVRQRTDDQKGNKEANFRRAAKKFGLPVSVNTRRKAYLEGIDWWTTSF